MSEIETREGVARALFDAQPHRHPSGRAPDWNAQPDSNRDVFRTWADAAIAATPAQTQTFKDGFAAGLEAAAKVADNIAVLGVKDEFHRGYQCAAKAIAGNVRAIQGS